MKNMTTIIRLKAYSPATPLSVGPTNNKYANSLLYSNLILNKIPYIISDTMMIEKRFKIKAIGELYKEKIRIPVVPNINDEPSGVSGNRTFSGVLKPLFS